MPSSASNAPGDHGWPARFHERSTSNNLRRCSIVRDTRAVLIFGICVVRPLSWVSLRYKTRWGVVPGYEYRKELRWVIHCDSVFFHLMSPDMGDPLHVAFLSSNKKNESSSL